MIAPANTRCYICDQQPPVLVLVSMRRPCTRKDPLTGKFLAREHTWWVCSADCAFKLGERAGLGSLEYEAATHEPTPEVRT